MSYTEQLAARMFDARLDLARRVGAGKTPTLTDIGYAVAELLGEEAAPIPSVVQGWFNGKPPRSPEMMIALAQVLGVDPGWLYFFPHSNAPAPEGWRSPTVSTGRIDTPEERAAALAEHVEEVLRQRAAKAKAERSAKRKTSNG